MKTKFTFETIRESITNCVRRFPLTILFSFALTIASIWMVFAEEYKGVLVYYFASGFLLSLMLELWGEEIHNLKRFLVVAGVCHLILAIDAIYLWNLNVHNYDTALYISRGAVEVALILGIFFLSFLKQKNDLQSWNFVRHLFFSVILCQIVGGVMTSGVSVLLLGMDSLFSLDFGYKAYSVNFIIWSLLLPQLLFLSRIPANGDKHNDEILHSGFLLVVTRYLFVPLVAAYMIVLYSYLLKILFTWTLPQGAVTYCVSAMMVGIIIIQFLLYPTLRSDESRSYERLASRWMPILALPLVALMTIGLIRRFSDYGITAPRLYALTLNLWFYAVCLLMWFTHCRRIHWVSLSFGALLLLTSAHPYNYMELTRLSMMHSLSKTIAENPPSHLPMSHSEFAHWIDSLPKEEQQPTYSKFQYLSEWCNRRSDLDGWLEKDVYLYQNFESFESEEDDVILENKNSSYFPWDADTLVYYSVPNPEIIIPEGAHKVVSRQGQTIHLKECPADSLIHFNATFKTSSGPDSATVVFSIPELRAMQRDSLPAKNYLDTINSRFPVVQPTSIVIREYRGALKVYCNYFVFME